MKIQFLIFLAILVSLNSFGQVYQDSFYEVKNDTFIYQRTFHDNDKMYYANVTPEYPSGIIEFVRLIQTNIKVPKSYDCFFTMIEFHFLVDKDGTVTKKEIVINDSRIHCDNDSNREAFKAEMIEIILEIIDSKMLKWKPAVFENEKVEYPVSVPMKIDMQ